MKKIVIIGASEFQNPLILKAKEMGFETHVFAWSDGAVGEKTADFFYPVSITEKDEILNECKRIKPEAVVTIASDLANITAQYVSEKLGLICNSERSIEISTNKYKMRQALKDIGVKTPEFRLVSKDEDISIIADKFRFPVIVKPTDRSGSRGITKVSNKMGLKEAIKTSIDYSFEKKAIIEEFIEGEEFSCECISYKGNHNILAITRKYTTGEPNYIETGHMEPSGLDEVTQNKVKEVIFKSLDALDIEFGASHPEFRISPNGEVNIIEIGSRMGGDCIGSDLVYISTGKDYLKMVVNTSCGLEPDLTSKRDANVAAIRFIFGKKDLDILDNIKKSAPEAIYFVSDIKLLENKVVDSSSRLGFYILCCSDTNQAKRLMEF